MNKILGIIFICCLSQNITAQIPTTDVVAMTQRIEEYMQMVEQLNTLERQAALAGEQIAQGDLLQATFTGSRGMSDLLNTPSMREARAALPENMTSVLSSMANGRIPIGSSEMLANIEAILGLYDLVSTGSSNQRLGQTDRQIKDIAMNKDRTNRALISTASADQSLSYSAEASKNIYGLMERIDMTPDLKASIDLQTRLLAENSHLSNRALEMQAIEMSRNASMDLAAEQKLKLQDQSMNISVPEELRVSH
jgi:type IV secretion system protein VirB5